MTYQSGQRIQATDYNTLAWTNPSIGGHWGIGTGNHGLGQPTSEFSTVSTSMRVTAAQWTGLIQKINSCLRHQGIATIAPSGVTVGNPISYFSILTTGSALAYNSAGLTGLALSDGAANVTSYTGNWGTTGNKTLAFTQTLTFASGDAARYFFNAGGKVKLSFSRTGGTGTSIDLSWSHIANTSCGTIAIGYNNTTKIGGVGSPTILLASGNGGYWAGTGSYITHFKQYDEAGGYYGSDYIQMAYHWSGTAANGGYPTLNIKTSWVNSSGVNVDGTASTALVVSSPSTIELSPTWGSPAFSGSVQQE